MNTAERERIRQAAILRGRRERREQGIPEQVQSSTMTARLAGLLSAPLQVGARDAA